MIKDYQNKEALAAMKRQLNEAIKSGGDREARITFVLIHMLSERHELMESAEKQKGEDPDAPQEDPARRRVKEKEHDNA